MSYRFKRWAGLSKKPIVAAPATIQLKRHIPQHRGPMHHPPGRAVVVHCEVLGHAVVPEGHVVGLPAPADGEFRAGGVGEQQLEDGLAFAVRELIDPGRETFIDEQRFAPADRVRADHRV